MSKLSPLGERDQIKPPLRIGNRQCLIRSFRTDTRYKSLAGCGFGKSHIEANRIIRESDMKCWQCRTELDLLEVLASGRVFECCECAYTLTLRKGFAPKILYDGPPPLDFYYHD